MQSEALVSQKKILAEEIWLVALLELINSKDGIRHYSQRRAVLLEAHHGMVEDGNLL